MDRKKVSEKKIYHVVWATHGSRISPRMIDYRIYPKHQVFLDDDLRLTICKVLQEIIKERNLHVIAFNILDDHIHMILFCLEDERDNIIRGLKGKSTHLVKRIYAIEEAFHLWTQKYYWKEITSEKQLHQTISYVKHNEQKHHLVHSRELQLMISGITSSTALDMPTRGCSPLTHKLINNN